MWFISILKKETKERLVEDVDEKMDKDHKVEFKSFVFQCT